MSTQTPPVTDSGNYAALAQFYADGVRVLLAPAGRAAGECGGRGPVSSADVAVQAERLATVSSDFTTAAASRLGADRVEDRIQAETALLAKALTDLDTSTFLLQTATDEERGPRSIRGNRR